MPLTPDDVIERVRKAHTNTLELRARMDADYKMWRLTPYNTNAKGGDAYKSYTSSIPRAFADKIVGMASLAKLFVQVPYGDALPDAEKRRYDDKERFVYGVLAAVDAQFARQFTLPYQVQVAWFLALRGACFARALLVREEGGTRIDVRLWDPRNTYWQLGPAGLRWVCHRTERAAIDVQEEYGVRLPFHSDDDLIEVYDYFDTLINAVVIDGAWLKQPTVHPSAVNRRVPVAAAMGGTAPLIGHQRLTDLTPTETIRDYADSIYSGARLIAPQWNEIMSIYFDAVERGRDQSHVLKTHTGEKPMEGNTNRPGTELQLQVGESYEPIPVPEISHAIAQLAGLVSGDFQRSSVPFTAYGDVPFPIAGVAINLLNQSTLTMLMPVLRGCGMLTGQVAEIVLDQYTTGAFDELRLDGIHKGRHYFSSVMSADRLRDLPRPIIKYVPDLPQDDAMALQFSQAAREGAVPLLSDVYLWENKLGVQDTAALADEIDTQLARRLNPVGLDLTLMQAAQRQGNEQLAMIYYLDMATKLALAQIQFGAVKSQEAGMSGGTPGGGTQAPPTPKREVPVGPVPAGGGAEPGLPATVPPPLDARKVQPMTGPRPGAREG